MKNMPPTASLATLLHAAHTAEHEVEARLGAMGLSLAKLAALKALADAGRQACREGVKVQRAAEQELLGNLTAAESRALAGLLGKIAGR